MAKEKEIYGQRFSERENEIREITWRVLCSKFFTRYIKDTDSVLDLGAGDGCFIRNIKAGQRIAVDLGDNVLALEAQGIKVFNVSALQLSEHLDRQVDVLFMSNFLEHLPSKNEVLHVLSQCEKVLKPGGRIIVLQPDISAIGHNYWDYIDHNIALTCPSIVEALSVSGFEVEDVIEKFLPYTAKSVLSRLLPVCFYESIVSFYLRCPVIWSVVGKQCLVIAKTKLDR